MEPLLESLPKRDALPTPPLNLERKQISPPPIILPPPPELLQLPEFTPPPKRKRKPKAE